MKTMLSAAKGFTVISIIAGVLFLAACGGGGGGDGGGTAPLSPATINDSTAPQVTSALETVILSADMALAPMTINTGSGIYSPRSLLRHAYPLINRGRSELAGFDSSTEPCAEAGSVTVNVSWDGPDDPSDCSQVQNPLIEFMFAGCQEMTEVLDGTMVMSITGDLCDETPFSFTINLGNLRYQSQDKGTDITFSLGITYRNIQYDQSGNMVGASAALSGSIVGTAENQSINVNYDNYTINISDLQYDGNARVTRVTAIIDGRFYGSVAGNQFDEQFDSLTLASEKSALDSILGVLVSIDGRYRGECLDGWATFETVTPIFIPESSSCPTSGELTISGTGQATITCNADGSVDIGLDGKVLHYATCDDLPECSVP